jgi:hypothetical protein
MVNTKFHIQFQLFDQIIDPQTSQNRHIQVYIVSYFLNILKSLFFNLNNNLFTLMTTMRNG